MASDTRHERARKSPATPRAFDLRHRTFRGADGTALDMQCVGDDGPLLVLANGLGGSMVAWRPLVSGLAGRYRIASWDYRGLYASGPPRQPSAVRIEDHCADLGILLDLLGDERAVVLGWSMGVQVAAQFALDRPERVAGLVLVCGAPGDPFAGVLRTTTSRTWVPAACRVVEAVPAPFGGLVRALAGMRRAPDLLRRIGVVAPSCDLPVLREMAWQFARLDWRVYGSTMRAMGRHDVWARLPEIDAPVLAVAGTRDLFTPVSTMARLAASVPHGELVVVEGATHYAPLEFPEVLRRAITGFLDERAAWASSPRRAAGAREGGGDVVEPV